MKKIVNILFIFISSGIFSQNIDSLKLALRNAKHDTVRCTILSQLAETASDEEWPKFNDDLKKIAEQNLKLNTENIYLHKMFTKFLCTSIKNKAFLAHQKGNISKAIQFYENSFRLAEQIGDVADVAATLSSIGLMYNLEGNIAKALEYNRKSFEMQEKTGDKTGMASSLNLIGAIYYKQNELENALKSFVKCLKLEEEIGDKKDMASTLNNIGVLYEKKGDLISSNNYHERSLKLYEEVGVKSGVAVLLNNLGFNYRKIGKFKIALEYFNKSLKVCEEIKDLPNIANAYNNIASVYLSEKQISNALPYSLKALELSKKIGVTELIKNSASILQHIYRAKGDYKNALSNYELFILMRDSINNITTKKAAIKNQMQYEYDKKEIEIKSVAKTEQEKIELKAAEDSKRQNLIIYGVVSGLIIVLVFSFFIFRSLQENKRKNVIITEQKHIVDEKQKEILDSIHYAKRIQTALITSEKYIERNLNELNKN